MAECCTEKAVHRVTREQLERESKRKAEADLVEMDRTHDDLLSKMRIEDQSLRDAARNLPPPVTAAKYPTGVFLCIGDGKELPVAFIENIEIIAPMVGSSQSYLINERPHVGFDGCRYHNWRTGIDARHSFDHCDYDVLWCPRRANKGHCHIAKAQLKITMSSGRTDSIEINPYACEAIHARAVEIWKTGK